MKDCHSEPDLTPEELVNLTAHPACDESCLGDCLYLDSEAETEAMLLDCLAKYRESKLLAADGADLDDVEYNMIMDVFMVHHNDPASKRSEALLREGVKHIHDSFRNRGEFHDPEGVDIKINWSVGNIYYINGETLWGTDYVTYGCNMSSNLGIRNTELYRYCKELAGTLGDGTRTCLIAPHKITHSSLSVAGFAWRGLTATHSLAGQVSRSIYVGGAWMSKTPIHEAGHVMGGRHTFDASNDCGVDSTVMNGDRVQDTPTETRTPGDPCFLINRKNHLSYGSQSGRVLYTAGQAELFRSVAFSNYPLTANNPRVYWPDETPTTPQPPTPPTPPSMKVEFTNVAYEVLDAEAKTIRFTMDVKNAVAIDVEGWGVDDDDNTAFLSPINYGGHKDGAILILNAENGWKCPITGTQLTGFQEVEDIDGKGIFIPVATNDGLTIEGLSHGNYTYRIKCKFTEKIGNVQSILSKRIHHQGNESFFYLFTWTNNQIHWDNTTNTNRRNTGYTPKLNELIEIHATRDLGMWVKAGSNPVFHVTGGNADKALINTAPLRIGFDHTTGGRGMGGVIYEIELYDRSYNVSEF